MNILKPFLIRLLKRADYSQILQYILEAKTGDATVFSKMSAHSVNEATEKIDWLVTVAQQTLKDLPGNEGLLGAKPGGVSKKYINQANSTQASAPDYFLSGFCLTHQTSFFGFSLNSSVWRVRQRRQIRQFLA